jgi:seryl-tRNA synthetase
LRSLELDKSFFDAQKHDKIKLKRLELRRKELASKILKLEHPNDGLTDIGRKLLSTREKEAEKQEKIEQLNQQIEAIDPEIEEIQQELDQKTLTFSGWVRVRIKS